MSTTDVPDLLFNLRTEITRIANDDQQHLLEQNITQEDLKKALGDLVCQLQKTAPKSTTDKWLSKTNSIVERLSPVIDAAVGLGSSFSPGPLIWNSIKIVLQISSSKSEVFEVLFDTLIYIADNMPRICSFGTNWPLESRLDNPGHAALAAILTYLTDASKTIQSKRNILTRGLDLSGMKEARAKLERTFMSADFESIARNFKKQQKVVNEERYEKLVEKLHTSNYESSLSRRRDARLEGTCSWSLNPDTRIGRWYNGTGASRLWITGRPGSGKSTLASYLIDNLPTRISEDEILLYYLCDSSDTATSVLKSLLVQILKAPDRRLYVDDLESLQNEVLPKHDDYQFSIQDMKKYLGLVSRSFTKLRIVVDGLDECDAFRSDATESDFESVKLINTLIELPHRTTRLLFISRKEPYLAELLAGWDVVELGQYHTTADDLLALASSEAEKLMKEIPFLTQRQDLVSEILVNADGMFIYIRLLFDRLRAAKSAAPVVVEEILARSPRGLDSMYEKYFSTLLKRNANIPGRIDMAIQVLQWLIVYKEPVELDRIREIIQIKPGDEGFDRTRLVTDIKAELREALGILVEVQYRKARIVHQSLRDFFRHSRTNSDPNAPYLQRLYVAMSPEAVSTHVSLSACTVACASSRIYLYEKMITHPSRKTARSWTSDISRRLERDIIWFHEDDLRESNLRVFFASASAVSLILYNMLLECALIASALTTFVYHDLALVTDDNSHERLPRSFCVDIAFALDSFAKEQLRISKFISQSPCPSPPHSLFHFHSFEGTIRAIFAHLLRELTWTVNDDLHDQINEYTSQTQGAPTDDHALVRDTVLAFRKTRDALLRLVLPFTLAVIDRMPDDDDDDDGDDGDKVHKNVPTVLDLLSSTGLWLIDADPGSEFACPNSPRFHPLRSVHARYYLEARYTKTQPSRIYSWDTSLWWKDYPSWFLVIWSLSVVVAFLLPLPLWIISSLGIIGAEGHRYTFLNHDTFPLRQMVRSLSISLSIGRVLAELTGNLSYLLRFISTSTLFQSPLSSDFMLMTFSTIILVGAPYGLCIFLAIGNTTVTRREDHNGRKINEDATGNHSCLDMICDFSSDATIAVRRVNSSENVSRRLRKSSPLISRNWRTFGKKQKPLRDKADSYAFQYISGSLALEPLPWRDIILDILLGPFQIFMDETGVCLIIKTTDRIRIQVDPRTYKLITVIVAQLASMNCAIPFSVAWYGPLPDSTLGAVNSTLNIIGVALTLDKIFTFIMAPGAHHALSILAELPDRFKELQTSFKNARHRQFKLVKKQWESMQSKTD